MGDGPRVLGSSRRAFADQPVRQAAIRVHEARARADGKVTWRERAPASRVQPRESADSPAEARLIGRTRRALASVSTDREGRTADSAGFAKNRDSRPFVVSLFRARGNRGYAQISMTPPPSLAFPGYAELRGSEIDAWAGLRRTGRGAHHAGSVSTTADALGWKRLAGAALARLERAYHEQTQEH